MRVVNPPAQVIRIRVSISKCNAWAYGALYSAVARCRLTATLWTGEGRQGATEARRSEWRSGEPSATTMERRRKAAAPPPLLLPTHRRQRNAGLGVGRTQQATGGTQRGTWLREEPGTKNSENKPSRTTLLAPPFTVRPPRREEETFARSTLRRRSLLRCPSSSLCRSRAFSLHMHEYMHTSISIP